MKPPLIVFPPLVVEAFSADLEREYNRYRGVPLSTTEDCPLRVDAHVHPSYDAMTHEWRAAEAASFQAEREHMRRARWSLICGKCDRKISECECG